MLKTKSLTKVTENLSIKWILLGMPFVIIVAFPLHFLYDWCSNNFIVAIFAPVNESVWEHLKLVFWPMLFWWGLGLYLFKNKINIANWVVSLATAEIVCILFILSFYYVYTGAFGIESFVLDILSLVFGVIVSQLLAIHIYKYVFASKFGLYLSLIIITILALAFIIFTFNPPNIPLFLDPVSKKYGI